LNKLNKVKKRNILSENLYLKSKGATPIQHLSREHVTYVLGVKVPLNESISINEELYKRILNEQLIYEGFLDSLKNYAKEKLDKTIDKINDWKDAAVMVYKLITNPQLLENFSVNFWKTFQQSTVKQFYTNLKEIGASQIIPKIEMLITAITNIKGWQKFMAATAVASIVKYVVEKIKAFPKEKILEFIGKYLTVDVILKELFQKITDWKSYIAWLEPIIGTIKYFYEILKPTLDKFKQALELIKPNPNPSPELTT